MSKVSKLVNGISFKIKKYSPEICFVTGAFMVVGGVISAIKATSDSQEELDYISERMDETEVKEEIGEITADEARRQRWVYRRQYAKTLMKNYSLTVGLTSSGLGLIGLGYKKQKDRIGCLTSMLSSSRAAYDFLASKYKDEHGEEAFNKLRYGLHEEEVEVINEDEDMSVSHKEKVDLVPELKNHSPYAIVFDETNPFWSNDPQKRWVFFENMQIAMNHDLKVRQGYLFLNQAYSYFKAKQKKIGNFAGWIYGAPGPRDHEVKLDITEIHVPSLKHKCGYEVQYIIDFNVDGNILDDFEKYQKN